MKRLLFILVASLATPSCLTTTDPNTGQVVIDLEASAKYAELAALTFSELGAIWTPVDPDLGATFRGLGATSLEAAAALRAANAGDGEVVNALAVLNLVLQTAEPLVAEFSDDPETQVKIQAGISTLRLAIGAIEIFRAETVVLEE